MTRPPRVLPLLALGLAVFGGAVRAQDNLTPVRPFRIFDNLYYVGLEAVSAYVLATGDGLIRIDALYPDFADHIARSIEDVGLTNHPAGGEIFQRRDRLILRGTGESHPFVDPDGLQQYFESLLRSGKAHLAEERSAGGR